MGQRTIHSYCTSTASPAWFWDVCYDEMLPDLQCYDLLEPYTNTFFHYPKSPTDQDIHFKLFTPSNPTDPHIMWARDAWSVYWSSYQYSGKVQFVLLVLSFLSFDQRDCFPWLAGRVKSQIYIYICLVLSGWLAVCLLVCLSVCLSV